MGSLLRKFSLCKSWGWNCTEQPTCTDSYWYDWTLLLVHCCAFPSHFGDFPADPKGLLFSLPQMQNHRLTGSLDLFLGAPCLTLMKLEFCSVELIFPAVWSLCLLKRATRCLWVPLAGLASEDTAISPSVPPSGCQAKRPGGALPPALSIGTLLKLSEFLGVCLGPSKSVFVKFSMGL